MNTLFLKFNLALLKFNLAFLKFNLAQLKFNLTFTIQSFGLLTASTAYLWSAQDNQRGGSKGAASLTDIGEKRVVYLTMTFTVRPSAMRTMFRPF